MYLKKLMGRQGYTPLFAKSECQLPAQSYFKTSFLKKQELNKKIPSFRSKEGGANNGRYFD